MAVPADTSLTYDNTVIREDLQEAYEMISPTECPFQQMAGRGSAHSTQFDWPVVELAAPQDDNRVIEGDAAVNDPATLAERLANYTQISDKTAEVSHTAQAVDAAAENVQRMAAQIALKMKEMKRDKEVMLLSNVAANAGGPATARVTAGLPAFLRQNTLAGAGGADPTLSGGTNGYPNAPATAGAVSVFLEDDLNSLIEACWTAGADPSIIMVNSGNKRRISSAFEGNATRYKDTEDKRVVNSIDFYDSDFGEQTIIPNRFQPTNNPAGADDSYNVFVLDPDYIEIKYLDEVQQKPLAETGHSMRTLVWCEYGLQIGTDAAHGVVRDTSNLIA